MTWLGVSILAQFILGTSAVFDKALLKREFFDPLIYTFGMAALGLFVFLLLPFGSLAAPPVIAALAILNGAISTAALFFFFLALQKGEASVALPVIGGFAPIFTLLISIPLLETSLGGGDLAGFILLVMGGVLFLGAERKEARLPVFLIAVASAFLFGAANVLTKIIFEGSSFISGVVWMRTGGALLAALVLLSPTLRERIRAGIGKSEVKNKFLYIVNRGYAALGGLFLAGAIFLSHPALVDATSSLKYVIIFLAAWILLRERFAGAVLWVKFTAMVLIASGFTWLGLVSYANNIPYDSNREIRWGMTFSTKMAEKLGFGWREIFENALQDLKPERLRLIAYWDEIEHEWGVYDFSALDYQIKRAKEFGAKVILVVGMRVPRWPECHLPAWARETPKAIIEEELLKYMNAVVERYKNQSAVTMWQVENEPFLLFGECPKRAKDYLEKEIALVRSQDSSRPILITDGGEFGDWYRASSLGDVFGTTMYRKVYPRFIGPALGVIEYPISPSYFRFKEKLIRSLTGEHQKRFLVSELQGEPWGKTELSLLPLEEQLRIFPPEYFKETLEYAKKAGFDEYYLWGVEWWYWLKEKHGEPEMWEIARETILGGN